MKSLGIAPALLPTDAAGHATELVRGAVAGGADLVLVLGGDGTINEAANGLIPSRVPLGVLPGGTANVLCNELGLGNHIERATLRLGQCAERRIAVGRVRNGPESWRYFLTMAGVGLDAAIVVKVNPDWKARTGKLAYWAAGFGEFFHSVEQFEAGLNGERQRYGYVLASRVRNYGGDLQIAGGASLLRDDFEIVFFRGSNPLRYAAYMLAVVARQVRRMPGTRTVHAAAVECAGSAHVQFDGEYGGRLPARFEIVPDALTLLMPPEYR